MTENKCDVSIIIVSYNTRELILKCLESLYRETTNISFETILVDNASRDNSVHAVAKKYPQVRLIALEENIGFARANNLGSEAARGKYLLLLNPDTVVINKAVEKIFLFAQQNQQAGVWGGRTFFPDGSLNPTSCYQSMTPWSLFCRAFGFSRLFKDSTIFNPETFGRWSYDNVREVDIVTGCFMLIRASLWRELEGFDPLFFMYGEEVDFCLRARKAGCRPMFTSSAEIIHYGGASESSQADRWTKVFQAKSTLIRRYWPRRYVEFGLRMLLIWVATRAAVMTVLTALAPQKYSLQKEKWANLYRNRNKWQMGFVDSDNNLSVKERTEPHLKISNKALGNSAKLNQMSTSTNIHVCLIASAGGHMSQLLRLAESWKGYDTFCVTTSEVARIKLQRHGHGKVYIVGECNRQHPMRVAKVLMQCMGVVFKERPDVVISTGAAAGCMVCFLGKLLGAKVVWIDSIANISRLSLSGRIIKLFADLFLTQWPELASKSSRVDYVGEVI